MKSNMAPKRREMAPPIAKAIAAIGSAASTKNCHVDSRFVRLYQGGPAIRQWFVESADDSQPTCVMPPPLISPDGQLTIAASGVTITGPRNLRPNRA